MMNLDKYNRKHLFKPKSFTPIAPDNQRLEGVKIFIQSVKSDQSINVFNRMMNEKSKSKSVDLRKEMEYDIELAKSVITSFEGVVINGEKIESTPENIEMLVREFDFIRVQANQQAQDDAFFFSD